MCATTTSRRRACCASASRPNRRARSRARAAESTAHASARRRLTAIDVDVWLGDPEALDDALAARLTALLAPGERERAARFLRPADRRAFVAAHALTRDALSHYADREPRAWRFVAGARGKPAIAPDQAPPGLAFNLTHTHGLVACAVAFTAALGIDAESVARRLDDRVARSVLVARELALLDAAGPDRQARFYELWTCKEAVAKALALGLHLPFESFGVALDPPRLAELPPAAPEAAGLRLALVAPLASHRLAVAAAATDALALRFRRSAVVPGHESAPPGANSTAFELARPNGDE